jgi:lipopolysaccharide transport system ATP-binding protein
MDKLDLIVVDNISKKFSKSLKLGLAYGLKDLVLPHNHSELRRGEFWSVKGISFSLKRGECLGIIGHNGAGKSTLLKMLSGLLPPDEGTIQINGSVGSLIELGAGFSPILTGRENIYANGSMLGFTKKQIDLKLNEIIEFAELEEFIDMPLQNYSSGMQVRLGFAVAAQIKPDILLIDEVLAVGDMGFVIKCFNHIDKLLPDTAVIFISHSMPQISRMCTKILVLEKGKKKAYTQDISEAINIYYNLFEGPSEQNYFGNGNVDLLETYFYSANKKYLDGSCIKLNLSQKFELVLVFEFKKPISHPDIHIAFFDKEQRNFAEINNFTLACGDLKLKGQVKFVIGLEELNFAQGSYSMTVGFSSFKDENVREIQLRLQSALRFRVENNIHGWAPIQLNPMWKYYCD